MDYRYTKTVNLKNQVHDEIHDLNKRVDKLESDRNRGIIMSLVNIYFWILRKLRKGK